MIHNNNAGETSTARSERGCGDRTPVTGGGVLRSVVVYQGAEWIADTTMVDCSIRIVAPVARGCALETPYYVNTIAAA